MRKALLKLKIALVGLLFGDNFALIVHQEAGDKDMGIETCRADDEEEMEHLVYIARNACEQDEKLKYFILHTALNYLLRYEVDAKNFIETLQNNGKGN